MKAWRFDKGFRKLLAWQEARQLTLRIYEVTKTFPKEELYGLTSQLRQAASSVDAQIAEGSRMPTEQHRKLYYDRAYASTAEVDNFLELAHDLGYLNDMDYDELLERTNHVAFLIHRLSASCFRKEKEPS